MTGADLTGLYDGEGQPLSGGSPPLAVANVLTECHQRSLAARPFLRKLQVIEPHGHNLALVYMVPIGGIPDKVTWAEIQGLMVEALDAGRGVMIHADSDDIAGWIAAGAWAFKGGGQA